MYQYILKSANMTICIELRNWSLVRRYIDILLFDWVISRHDVRSQVTLSYVCENGMVRIRIS